MDQKLKSILIALSPALVLMAVFYIALPIITGKKDGIEYGVCLSLFLILASAALGGLSFGDSFYRGTSYQDVVIAKSREGVAKQREKSILPVVNIGLYVGVIGVLLLIAGIIAYIVLGD